ncbi:MAG: hypothetical protein EWV83_16100 [Microcystis sp. M_OC_Ca_00000000_S217Cul]|uniref:hypothetical protein n=1 Tax=unclassified Microcystis TaxID=2643300 RepID=UPI001197D4CA|nr:MULTISPECIES: hypothetical protein [unclassified Microcystis]TRT74163.1 MAG: hypothetical protein EWV83_16100 [Microcystis sp. M_OC_Ca_00000000_S217Cul]TRT84473.1 MAG: hypothetical protein EWV66_20395 [Microcystis sp. M_OC_Ca_00000000_C217Col]
MTKSRNKSPKTQSSDQKLNIINAKAAGIDLGAREHWVCVPQELSQETKNQSILLMILDKFLNLQGTCIQGYRHLENIGIV